MTTSCSGCGQDVGLIAFACPNCGQPTAYGLIKNMSPQQRKDMGDGIVILFLIFAAVVIGTFVLFYLSDAFEYVSQSASRTWSRIPWSAMGTVISLIIRTIATAILLFLPFGVAAGLLSTTKNRRFKDGYLLGQFIGPIGLIVVVFQEPVENKASKKHRLPAIQTRIAVSKKPFSFRCSNCGKNYSVEEESIGYVFNCVKCGKSNRVQRPNSDPSEFFIAAPED